jgi:hypothetical protein
MRGKEYCILNKTYDAGVYNELRKKIIEQMKKDGEYGEFFPAKLSPFAYNETTAQEYFPLTREQAEAKGYLWREREKRNYTIGGDILACAHKGECTHDCTTAFRLIPNEIQFYERMKLPTPALCPNCRHARRMQWRNPPRLWTRACARCKKPIKTSYAPPAASEAQAGGPATMASPLGGEIIFCESCYHQEVV